MDLIEDGNQVVVAHGNGPQVGIINNAMAPRGGGAVCTPVPLGDCIYRVRMLNRL